MKNTSIFHDNFEKIHFKRCQWSWGDKKVFLESLEVVWSNSNYFFFSIIFHCVSCHFPRKGTKKETTTSKLEWNIRPCLMKILLVLGPFLASSRWKWPLTQWKIVQRSKFFLKLPQTTSKLTRDAFLSPQDHWQRLKWIFSKFSWKNYLFSLNFTYFLTFFGFLMAKVVTNTI